MHRPTLRRRTCWTLILAVFTASCATSWAPYDPPTVESRDLPDLVRLTLEDGERVTLRDVVLEDDSLYVGTDRSSATRQIPRSLVRSLEEGDPPNAAIALVGLAGGIVAGLYILAIAAWGVSGG